MSRPPSTAWRVTASLRAPDVANLDEVAEATHLTRNDAIRKALATEAWVQRELKRGSAVMIRGRNGILHEVAFGG
jgi:predicted transcriptional regulator